MVLRSVDLLDVQKQPIDLEIFSLRLSFKYVTVIGCVTSSHLPSVEHLS